MKPYVKLDEFVTPDGRTMSLHQHGDDLFVNFDGRELMSTRTHRTECTLARVACRELAGKRKPRVLIGGLGLGYTVRAALDALPTDAVIDTAEVFPGIIGWNREHAERLGNPLEDARVHLHETDVIGLLDGPRRYDAILLDVDNGPIAETLESNARLYDDAGLQRLRAALASKGLLAVWSAHRDPGFERRLRSAGFREVRVEVARTGKRKGARHVIFLAR